MLLSYLAQNAVPEFSLHEPPYDKSLPGLDI